MANVIPEDEAGDNSDAEAITKRVSQLFENSGMGHPADGARKPTGYKVWSGWTSPGQSTPPHKKDETLTAAQIVVEEGLDAAGKEKRIGGLVQNGNLIPIYADAPKVGAPPSTGAPQKPQEPQKPGEGA